MAKRRKSELSSSLLYIIIGALLVIFKGGMLSWLMTAVGIFFLIFGALDILSFNMIGGVVSILIAVAILVLGWLAVTIVLLVFGILIALKGAVAFLEALRKKRRNLFELLFPLLTVVLGLALAFGNGFDVILVVVGVLFIVDGAIGVLGAIKR